jgi:LPS sulfotransferase NodH
MQTVQEQIAGKMHPSEDAEGEFSGVAYLICSAPRTGSNALCEGLKRSRRAGRPFEYFNPMALKAYQERTSSSAVRLDEYMKFLKKRRVGSEGVLGIKAHYHQLRGILKSDDSIARNLRQFSHLVLLERRNKLRQAISDVRAQASGVWYANDANTARRAQAIQPIYSSSKIATSLSFMLSEEEGWKRVFAACQMPYLTIYYEDMMADYNQAVTDVSRHIGDTAPHEQPISISTRQLGDGLNSEWEARFKRDALGLT